MDYLMGNEVTNEIQSDPWVQSSWYTFNKLLLFKNNIKQT